MDFLVRRCKLLQYQFTPRINSLGIWFWCDLFIFKVFSCSVEANQKFYVAISTLQGGFNPPFAAEPIIFYAIDDLLANL